MMSVRGISRVDPVPDVTEKLSPKGRQPRNWISRQPSKFIVVKPNTIYQAV
jgi:hypothetical protein